MLRARKCPQYYVKEDELAKYVPKHIKSPITVLIFEGDEIVPFILFFAVGLLVNAPEWGAVTGFFASFAYKKGKERYPRAYLKHLLYSSGLADKLSITKGQPKSWQNRFES